MSKSYLPYSDFKESIITLSDHLFHLSAFLNKSSLCIQYKVLGTACYSIALYLTSFVKHHKIITVVDYDNISNRFDQLAFIFSYIVSTGVRDYDISGCAIVSKRLLELLIHKLDNECYEIVSYEK